MNSANFHQYLRNPSMLHQLNYQELKSLVLEYPYSPNLRYLMLAKSLTDGQREYDRNLVLASLSSIDRRKLRQLVTHYSQLAEAAENVTLTEDFLELKDLSTLEDIMEVNPKDAGAAKSVAIDPNLPSSDSIEFLDDLSEAPKEIEADVTTIEANQPNDLEDLLLNPPDTDTEIAPVDEPVKNLELPLEESDTPATEAAMKQEKETSDEMGSIEIEESLEGLFDETTANEPEQEATPEEPKATISDQATTATSKEETPPTSKPAPSPKSAFSSYRKQMQFRRPGLLSTDLNITPAKTPKTKEEEKTPPPTAPIKDTPPLKDTYMPPADVARKVAAQSVSEDNSIATETLAGILARQGHFDKAIKMYEKLSLQYPEKSDTFAAKIEKLKNS